MSSKRSRLRSTVKRVLYPLLPESAYRLAQAIAMAADIRSGRLYEPELELVRYAVQPGDTVLDIGANFGLYTYAMARAVGAAGRVYSFEPVPFTHRTLATVLRLLHVKNATVVPKGCSDTAGTVRFTVPLQEAGGFS